MSPDHTAGSPEAASDSGHGLDWSSIAAQAVDALRSRIAVVDEAGTIVAVNSAWRTAGSLTDGVRCDVCEGRSVFTLCAPVDDGAVPRFVHGVTQVLDGVSPTYEADIPSPQSAGGGWLSVRVSPLSYAGRRMAVVACDDISPRKQMELELRETQEAHDRAQALTHAGSWRADFGTQTFTPSAEGARLLGWTSEPHSFADLFALIHPDDRERQELGWMSALKARSRFDIEHRMLLRGEVRWVRVMAEFVFGPDGRALTAYGVTQDITEMKGAEDARAELEQQLRQAHKLDAIGLLAGGIAHDFNNLLTVIGGNSELLKPHVPGVDGARLLAEIRDAGARAGALTRQLLAFSRSQVLAPAVVQVNTLICRVEAIVSRLIGEDIRCEHDLAPDAGYVRVDAGQFEQVILNLAVNARDAMPHGGRLRIRTRAVRLDDAAPGFGPDLAPGTYVEIALSDTGVGMPPEVLARVFEPFFTTKEHGRGTGLGLSMAFGIVKQSGGHIAVTSQVGEGTTFVILLPQAQEVHEAPPATAPGREVARGGETILLVEDEANVRKLSRLALERSGYTVLVAEHGLAALELAARHPAPIDMLVTDVVMPEMRGPDLARTLEERRPGLRVLFVSGYVQDAFDRAGVSDANFLLKPFSLKDLSDRVRTILDAPRTSSLQPPGADL